MGLEPLKQHRGHLTGRGVEIAAGGPLVGVTADMSAGWGDHIATPTPPIHMLEVLRMRVAETGGGQIEMPPASTGADQRPRAHQAMLGRQLLDGLRAGGSVDVQDIEPVAGGQADVGLGVAGPPGQHPGPIGRRLLNPVGH